MPSQLPKSKWLVADCGLQLKRSRVLAQHVGTNNTHLLIEFIVKRVNPGEAMQYFYEILSFKLTKQSADFFVQSIGR